jgi:DegV family protein with EDD domain
VNSARQAAGEFPDKVTVVDSTSLSLGFGFQVLAAAEAAEDGLDAALAAIEETRRNMHVVAALDTMDYLRRSGRIPGAVTFFGGILSIKPLVELNDGQLKPIGAVRTTKQSNQRIFQMLLEHGRMERLALMHTNAENRAREVLHELMQQASQSVPRDILMVNVTTVIGTHAGPNGLGFAAVRA